MNIQRRSYRKERVAKLLTKEISHIISNKSSFLNLPLLTINHIKMSNDLKIANIYFSFYGAEIDNLSPQEVNTILNDKSAIFRHELGRRVYLKSLPELRFYHDTSLHQANKVLSIIETLKYEQTGS